MSWLSIFNEVFLVSWLVASLWLLYRHAIGGGQHVQRLQLLLNENTARAMASSEKAAQAAQTTSEAALKAVEVNARIVALLESDRKDQPGA